jgi:alpha-beta hydrolase superfamily lysophospholipase
MLTKRRLVLIVIFVVLLVFFVGLWLAGSALTAPEPQAIGDLPADLPGMPVQFRSSSGTTIHGWFVSGRKGGGAIVLMHGVRANRLSMLERARFLSQAGYAVLLFDFQAHGESGGQHITFGYLESRDAQAAVSFLRSNAPDERIGVIGISMGGAAALLASPPLDVNAMVLEMVYPTIDQAIGNRLMMRLGGWAGSLTPLLSWQLKPRLGIGAEALRPIDHIGRIGTPKLLVVGAEDQHTTLEESRQMFEAAGGPKEMWVVSGAKHVDLYAITRTEYEQHILNFFGKYLRSQGTEAVE